MESRGTKETRIMINFLLNESRWKNALQKIELLPEEKVKTEYLEIVKGFLDDCSWDNAIKMVELIKGRLTKKELEIALEACMKEGKKSTFTDLVRLIDDLD